ncbi:MAG: GDSL-type esterase/lipase family protein [Ruminococcus flavefaciens]|nr:GDSL-type esterase/lipase family protein [Ruminococcus flavefaciens]MCM1230444.1 GDSL-type esterase/lipase family protein [Ruminococcus flavefaciens]
MKKFQQTAYTLILMATCFVASPFIIHKIWQNSSEAKKPVNNIPQSESSQPSEPDSAETTEPPSDDVQPATDNPEPDVPFVASDVSYFDNALFIGDSRTVGIKEYGTLKNADYFCSVGMSAYQIDDEEIDGITFDEVIDQKQYGKVYIMLGINEVGNDAEVTLTSYRAIVEKIKVHQPNAVIFVQGNLHVSASAETDVITNSAIDYLNSKIESLADNKRVFYIDINEVYDDENGCFTESYTSDGVHPLALYYTKWCEWLCEKTIVSDDVPTTEPVYDLPENSDVQDDEYNYDYDFVPPETSEQETTAE